MFQRLLQSKWLTFVILGGIVLMGWLLVRRKPGLVAIDRESSYLDAKIADTERELKEAQENAAYYSSPAYLERQARMTLNYKKPDEQVVYVYHTEKTEVTPTLTPLKSWQEWWYYLISRPRD